LGLDIFLDVPSLVYLSRDGPTPAVKRLKSVGKTFGEAYKNLGFMSTLIVPNLFFETEALPEAVSPKLTLK